MSWKIVLLILTEIRIEVYEAKQKLNKHVISNTNYYQTLIKLDFRIKYSFKHHRKKDAFLHKEDICKGRGKHDQILNTNHELDIKYLTRSQGLYPGKLLFSDHRRYGLVISEWAKS